MTETTRKHRTKKSTPDKLPKITFTKSTVLSLIVGLVTLSLVGFSGMLIGAYVFQVPEIRASVTPSTTPPGSIARTTPTKSPQQMGFSSITCPKNEWVNCTTTEARTSRTCTPEYLASIKETCPEVKGAVY